MKKRILFLLFFVVIVTSAFTQTREDITVYIAPVMAADHEQAAYFLENFTAETQGAGYSVIDNPKEADYTLKMEVKPNMVMYDDGTEEQAPDDEPQFILVITLLSNETSNEVVTFTYPFSTTDEMYDFNLYLLYETMANVPLTKLGSLADDNRWRNKWLYVRASFDYPITFYQLMDPQALWGAHPNRPEEKIWHNLDHRINPFPAATFGIEFQYLNWMSIEANFNINFGDPMSNTFIPSIQVEQKFPIKPSKNFMIEPYGLVSFPVDTSVNSLKFPKLGVGGGVQLGVKGGSMGAFFVDVNYIYYLGDVVTKNENTVYPNPSTINYRRFIVGMGIGYKIGILNRKTVDDEKGVK